MLHLPKIIVLGRELRALPNDCHADCTELTMVMACLGDRERELPTNDTSMSP